MFSVPWHDHIPRWERCQGRQCSWGNGQKFHYLFIASSHGTRILSCTVHSACVPLRAAQVGQQEQNWLAQEGSRMALISRRAFLSSVALAGASVLARGVSQRGPWAQGTAPALV